jgi:glucose-1-phosphate cytidylyltransferase
MKAVILAGGMGTRLSEETDIRPKPMVEIGGMPILWHIMKIYSAYGINEFIICLGYKGYMIKEYFYNYMIHHSDITVDLSRDEKIIHNSRNEPWKVTLIDTGEHSSTGGRLRRVKDYIGDKTFCFTYGDGLCDVDITKVIDYHKGKASDGILATLTAIMPQGRYGSLEIDGEYVRAFNEKPEIDTSYVNGGFFVLEPEVIDYIEGDPTPWEGKPIEALTREGRMLAYKHHGFWGSMDTLRDKIKLEEMWNSGNAPWKIW